ncbi:MAG: tetratricopeptide repeat protein [Bacteroidia bacterium]|nr:tetratricopeptide repeat protein [Bacteroidia bacterium]
MLRLPCILLLLIASTPTFSQNSPKKDSLLNLWLKSDKADTVGMKALTILIQDHYISKDPDSAYLLSIRLFESALEAENLFYQAVGQGKAGEAMMTQGQYEKSNVHHQKGLEIWKQLGNKPQVSSSYNALGAIFKRLGKLDQAIEFLEKSIAINRQIGDSLKNAGPFINLASIHEVKGELLTSLAYNKRGLELCKLSNDELFQAIACNNLANNYKDLGDIVKASEKYLEAQAINEKIGDTWGVVNNLNNRSVMLIEDKQFKRAYSDLEKAKEVSQRSGLVQGEAMSYANIAFLWTSQEKWKEGLDVLQLVYKLKEEKKLEALFGAYLEQELGNALIQLNRLDEAESYIKKGLEINKSFGNVEGIATVYHSLSQLNRKKGDWNQAFIYAQKGYNQATTLQNVLLQSNLAKELVDIHKHFNRPEEALEMYEIHMGLRDSLYNEENTRSLINQGYRYAYEQQAFRDSVESAIIIAQKEEENRQRKATSYFLLFGLAMTILFGLVLWNRFRLTRSQKKIIEGEKVKLDRSNTQLNAANQKLKELDQFKSRFFTNISHEFRTPLTVIGGMIDQVRTNPERWLEKGSQMIKANVNNLLHLINQILDLRKLESGNLKLSIIQDEVVTFFRTHTESFRSLAEHKGVELNFYADFPQLNMDFDPDKLVLIQTNLISNAIKFTPTGGTVEVKVGKTDEGQLLFEVIDTGIGISTEQLPLIFDRFYQADNEYSQAGEGTGIGLSLTKELVRLMKGSIKVESQQGKGSTFRVGLPITQNAPIRKKEVIFSLPQINIQEEVKQEEIGKVTAEGELPSLLIIEDNPDVVTYISACLEDSYRLFIARDGEEGIATALEYVPDLIISDVMMPKKNGYEVCQVLKTDERTSHIPIVLLTAKADRDSRLDGLGKGADAYLTKPFDQEELFIRLEQLLVLRKRLQRRYAGASQAPPPEEPGFQQEDTFIEKVRQALLDRLDDSSYKPDDLNRDLGISRTQMYNKVKALTGQSPSHFIRSIRLAKAKELLQSQDLRIADIAYSVGFADPQYFARTFSKENGMSPSAWREKQGV